MFHKATSFIVLILFILWIVPLGAFIKPAQEEIACNGARAICLCTALLIKAVEKGKDAAKVAVKIQNTQQAASTIRVHNDFLFDLTSIQCKAKEGIYPFNEVSNLYSLQISRRIDHIPKV